MPYSGFFKSMKTWYEITDYADVVQIMLMLEVLFAQDSQVEDLFSDASSGSEPSLYFSNYCTNIVLDRYQKCISFCSFVPTISDGW